jgi:hypothetical protein
MPADTRVKTDGPSGRSLHFVTYLTLILNETVNGVTGCLFSDIFGAIDKG